MDANKTSWEEQQMIVDTAVRDRDVLVNEIRAWRAWAADMEVRWNGGLAKLSTAIENTNKTNVLGRVK